jgi:hypothetical protein
MFRRMTPLCLALSFAVSCADDGTPRPSAGGPGGAYVVGFNVNTPQMSSVGYLTLQESLSLEKVDTARAIELGGSPSMIAFGNAVLVGDSEKYTYTRYDRREGGFVKGETINFSTEGMTWLPRVSVISDEQAFVVSDKAYEIIEWNPTSMRITRRHSVASLRRSDFQLEWRGETHSLYRPSDGALFLYLSYHNDRKTFSNAFHVALFDTRTGQVELIEDDRCGETAGFGGWVDQQEDVYLLSDNFGALGEVLGGIKRRGSKVYTSGLDMSRQKEFDTAYNFLFGPIHRFFQVDLAARTAAEVTAMPPAGVGWNPFQVEGRLYVPRTTATFTRVGDWETSLTDVFVMEPEGNGATRQFQLPGTVELLARMP